jgi:competence ComEA-like helix-hairpin-helix protein
VVVLVIRYAVPDSNIKIEHITAGVIEAEDTQASLEKDSSTKIAETKFKKPYIKKAFGKSDKLLPSKVNYTIQRGERKAGSTSVDINLSDTAALKTLPGIGPVLSARVVKYRNFLGGFARIEQLKEIYGLSEETFELIKSRVTADSSFIKRINLNTADYKELTKIRYLEKYEIISILKYRQLKGKVTEIGDLVDNKLITAERAKQILPYLSFE